MGHGAIVRICESYRGHGVAASCWADSPRLHTCPGHLLELHVHVSPGEPWDATALVCVRWDWATLGAGGELCLRWGGDASQGKAL